ncbi:MAG: hypothetical protein GY940_12385 [bacterium]|nr:hypothetical protein [bacterium]
MNPLLDQYDLFFPLQEIFPYYGSGIITGRDRFTIHRTPNDVYKTVTDFVSLPVEEAREKYNLGKDIRDWGIAKAQRDLAETGINRERIVPILYRPFDTRYTYYTGKSRGMMCFPRPGTMSHLLPENIGLVAIRRYGINDGIFSDCMVTDSITESRVCSSSHGMSIMFPLYRYPFKYHFVKGRKRVQLPMDVKKFTATDREPNINPRLIPLIKEAHGKEPHPEQVFHYVYALLHSTIYRETYNDRLKTGFPRIPLTRDHQLFLGMAEKGKELAECHLMKLKCKGDNENEPVERNGETGLINEGSRKVFKHHILYHGLHNQLYINEYTYFTGITPEIWEFKSCGRQVIRKWLFSYHDRNLSAEDEGYFIRMIRAIKMTFTIQGEINSLYPEIEKNLVTVN